MDEIVPEPLGGAHTNPMRRPGRCKSTCSSISSRSRLCLPADRLKQRYAKFRAFGHFSEKQPAAPETTGGLRSGRIAGSESRSSNALSLDLPAHLQRTRLGRARAGAPLPQTAAAGRADRRILGNQRPAGRRQRHREWAAGRQRPALAHGEPRSRSAGRGPAARWAVSAC